MNDRRDTEKVQLALNVALSGLKDDPWLAQRVLAGAKGENRPVKKKLSIGFVLVIVLVLAAAGALALTLSAYYEKVIKRESEKGAILDWSASDKVALVQWMVEAGISLDDSQVAQITDGSLTAAQQDDMATSIIRSYYPARDKLLTTVDIIAKEYGEYEQWPLELRAWYTETLEKHQHEQSNGSFAKNVLPQENDMTQEQARQFADKCLTEILGVDHAQIGSLEAQVFFQEDAGSAQAQRIWYFNYYEKGSQALLYYVYLHSDGTLLDCGRGEEPATTASELNDEFNKLIGYHSDAFFTVEGLAAFANELAPRINRATKDGGIDKWPAYFAQIPYALPDGNAIPAEKAREIGTQAILDRYGWSMAQLEQRYVYTLSYRIYPSEKHEWRLAYRIPQEGKLDAFTEFYAGKIPFCIIVRIDPFAATVMDIQEGNDVDRYWFGE